MRELNEYGLLVPDTPHTHGTPIGLQRFRGFLGSKYTFKPPRRALIISARKPPDSISLDSRGP